MFKNMNNYGYTCVLFTSETLQQIDETLKLRIETILLVVVWFSCNKVVLSHLFIHCFQLTPPPQKLGGAELLQLIFDYQRKIYKKSIYSLSFQLTIIQ